MLKHLYRLIIVIQLISCLSLVVMAEEVDTTENFFIPAPQQEAGGKSVPKMKQIVNTTVQAISASYDNVTMSIKKSFNNRKHFKSARKEPQEQKEQPNDDIIAKQKNIEENLLLIQQYEDLINKKFLEDSLETKKAKKHIKLLRKKKNQPQENVENSSVEQSDPILTLIDNVKNQSKNQDVFTPPIQLSLKDCISIALVMHPSIMSAKLNTDIYKSYVIEAWANYFPTFELGTNYDYSRSRYHDYHYSYSTKNYYAPTVSAGMLLFDFGKTKTQADIAHKEYSASKHAEQDSINNVIYNVKSAYYNLLFAQKQVDTYKQTIEDFDLQLECAKKYFAIGKKAQIDVVIAEYNAGSARLNLVKAINTLDVAKVALANAIGLPEISNYEINEDFINKEYDVDLDILLEDAYSIRPDLLSSKNTVESYQLGIRKAKRAFSPDLTMSGSTSYMKLDSEKQSAYNLGVNLSYSNLNLLQLKKELDIAVDLYKKSLADYEQLRQEVYLEVNQSVISLNNSKESVKVAEKNVEQAKAQQYHATGRYKAGLGNAIELKDSENTYLEAQLQYYQALLDYHTEAANLEKIVGRPILNNNVDL